MRSGYVTNVARSMYDNTVTASPRCAPTPFRADIPLTTRALYRLTIARAARGVHTRALRTCARLRHRGVTSFPQLYKHRSATGWPAEDGI